MQRKAIWASIVVLLLAAFAFAQEDYLDVYTVQVKPEKRAEFDAITKKLVSANHQNAGDSWLAIETVYGPGDRVTFISTRKNYADIEKATDAFYGSMQKAFGKNMDTVMQSFSQCIVSSRSEIRRRRWDLSSALPADPAAYAKLIAGSRWLRTSVVHIRPGQVGAFEAILKDIKAAREKANPPQTTLVSQAVAGQEGTVFYVTSVQSSLAGYDGIPSIQKLLGDEAYDKYLKSIGETVSDAETVISRFLPALSNAPDEIASIAPDYWRPKVAAPMNAKATKEPIVKASSTTKVEGTDKH